MVVLVMNSSDSVDNCGVILFLFFIANAGSYSFGDIVGGPILPFKNTETTVWIMLFNSSSIPPLLPSSPKILESQKQKREG